MRITSRQMSMTADALTRPNGAEPGGTVHAQGGDVFGEDTGLDGPDPGGFGRVDQEIEWLLTMRSCRRPDRRSGVLCVP